MESVKLNAAWAAALIRRLGEHLEYNISIMDRDGIIIASRDPALIGIFHHVAYHLITAGSTVESVAQGDERRPGVKPGIVLPIANQGEIVGVVGVNGDPKEIGPVGYAVKTSVEAMIELELYKERTIRHLDKKNLFLNYLLYEEDTPRAVVEGLAVKLGYKPELYRAPILLPLPEGMDANEALAMVKRSGAHAKQDISCVTPDGALLVFKTIPFSGNGIFSEYKEEATRFAAAAAAALGSGVGRGSLRAYISSFQANFTHYRAAYRQVLWLAERFSLRGLDSSPVFFQDHVQEYLASRVPRSELCNIFGATVELLPVEFGNGLHTSIEALCESAFNAKEAAARLGIHRNTLTARLERLREIFGTDLRWDAHARAFLSLLTLYLQLPGARPQKE